MCAQWRNKTGPVITAEHTVRESMCRHMWHAPDSMSSWLHGILMASSDSNVSASSITGKAEIPDTYTKVVSDLRQCMRERETYGCKCQ